METHCHHPDRTVITSRDLEENSRGNTRRAVEVEVGGNISRTGSEISAGLPPGHIPDTQIITPKTKRTQTTFPGF